MPNTHRHSNHATCDFCMSMQCVYTMWHENAMVILVRQPNPISGLDVVLEYKVFLMLIIDV